MDNSKQWYIIHTYSGYERKVAESLMNRIQAYDLGECIGQILIPTEDVVEMKAGKKVVSTKLTFPGYILVEMDMTDKAWHVVRGTPKVTGFISTGKKPTPLTEQEINEVVNRVSVTAEQPKPRFTFDRLELVDGVGLVPIVMGLFGISEVLLNLEQVLRRDIFETKIKGLFPSRKDWRQSLGAMTRGSLLGFFLGILPGGGAVISSFISYAIEKRVSRHPEQFGKGAIEGVAGPEAANNAATGGAFIPLLTLGIPPNVVMAMLLGAFMIHGVTPGPLMMKQNPGIFWGVIVSMYIGNFMLLVLNLPLIGMWVQVLKVPYKILFPLILLFCLIGVYSVGNAVFDIYIMILFGIVGYLMKKFDYEGAPLVLAFVLGPLMENNLRKSLIMSQGDFSIFFTRPLAAASLIVALFLLVSPLIPYLRRKRQELPKEEVS